MRGMRCTVVIVDDHAAFRVAARALLESAGFDVLGEAGDGIEAIEVSRRLRPDVVLVDVQIPGVDGFDVARALTQQAEGRPAVVLVSGREQSDYGRRALTCGARAFIRKEDLSAAALNAAVS